MRGGIQCGAITRSSGGRPGAGAPDDEQADQRIEQEELGTLDGPFVTCAMHCAQFDVTTGAALSGPVPADLGDGSPLPIVARYLQHVGAQMSHVRMESIRTYETNVESGWVHIAL